MKSVLDIDPSNTNEDKNLNFYVATASDWIGEYLGRKDFSYRWRTEYYGGTNTQRLPLNFRPVYTSPTPVVILGQNGAFGAMSGGGSGTTLTYGQDFVLQVDQPINASGIGTSRCGLLIRLNAYWNRPWRRSWPYLTPYYGQDYGQIQVQYQAGYTVDDLPSQIREACNILVSNIRFLFPLGVALNSESYEERSVSIIGEKKDYLMGIVKPMLFPYRNWKF